MTVFHASLETLCYQFDAYGETPAKARKALYRGLVKHGQQAQLSLRWYDDFRDSIVVNQVEFGDCLRDNQLLTKGDLT